MVKPIVFDPVTRAMQELSALGISDVDGLMDVLLSLDDAISARATPAQLGPYRNKLINGNFDFWQRGTAQTATGYGSADRWLMQHFGSSKTVTRQAFTLGQTDVPGNPFFFCRTVVTSSAGAGNYVGLTQRIESVTTFAGETVTISFWAKADAARNVSVELFQLFGTGGSPSANVGGIGVQKLSLTTSWQFFTVTAAVPSMAGKTLGTNGDHCLILFFWFDAGSSFDARTDSLGHQSGTFDFSQVQIESGSVATPFEIRHRQQELSLCQRYFEKSYTHYDAPGLVTANGVISYRYILGVELTSLGFRVEKRVPPSVVLYSPDTGTSGVVRNNTTATDVAASAGAIGSAGFIVTLGAGQTNGNNIRWHWAAESEL